MQNHVLESFCAYTVLYVKLKLHHNIMSVKSEIINYIFKIKSISCQPVPMQEPLFFFLFFVINLSF